MAILAGDIRLKISFRIQFRDFMLPWVRKDNSILFVKGSNFSSSVPVRYIPKKSSKSNESESSLPIKGLEKNDLRKSLDGSKWRNEVKNGGKGAQRSNVQDAKFHNQNRMTKNSLLFDDDRQEVEEENRDWGFIEDGQMEDAEEFIEEPEEVVEEIKVHQEKDVSEQNLLQASKTMQDAENLAIKLLAKRALTVVELRKKLNGRKFSPNIIEAVINNFKSRGLINDSLYAEAFSRSRWTSSCWGPRRIKQALLNRGINATDADKGVKLVFREDESDADQESRLGMSKLSMDQLFVQATKQWLRSQDASKETRKSRIIRWLQYRGFNWAVTSFILKKLESQYPP